MNDATHLSHIKKQRAFIAGMVTTVREKQSIASAASSDLKAHQATLAHARTDLDSLIDNPGAELPFPDAAVKDVGGTRKALPAPTPAQAVDHKMAAAGERA